MAMAYLAKTDLLAHAPHSHGAGDIGGAGGEGGVISPRALPYHFTVVMIEPTVIVMNFDLGRSSTKASSNRDKSSAPLTSTAP